MDDENVEVFYHNETRDWAIVSREETIFLSKNNPEKFLPLSHAPEWVKEYMKKETAKETKETQETAQEESKSPAEVNKKAEFSVSDALKGLQNPRMRKQLSFEGSRVTNSNLKVER